MSENPATDYLRELMADRARLETENKALSLKLNTAAKAWVDVKARIECQAGSDAQQRGMFWDACSDLNHALLDLIEEPKP